MKIIFFATLLMLTTVACNHRTPSTESPSTPPSPRVEPVTIDAQKLKFVDVFIKGDDAWFPALIPGGNRNTAMVNASNEQTTFGGGGINGAMAKYFTFKGVNAWGPLYESSDAAHSGKVASGSFVYSKHAAPIAFDYQFHAVGPQKSAYEGRFAVAREELANMTINMLEFAKNKNIENIVIPAISTEIFAGGDENFKKEMYEGMTDGILKFIRVNGNKTKPTTIYLNLWTKKNNPGRERLESQLK